MLTSIDLPEVVNARSKRSRAQNKHIPQPLVRVAGWANVDCGEAARSIHRAGACTWYVQEEEDYLCCNNQLFGFLLGEQTAVSTHPVCQGDIYS